MMRGSLRAMGIILACAGLLPVQAATPRQGTFTVKGKLNGGCVLPQSAPLTLNTTVPANGKLDPALSNATWTITGISCNASSQIKISARSLRLNVPRSSLTPSQSQTINFTAKASGWAPSAAMVTTGEATALGTTTVYAGIPQVQPSPKTGSIVVSVSDFVVSVNKGSSSNSAKPIDGAYSATIILTLTPAA